MSSATRFVSVVIIAGVVAMFAPTAGAQVVTYGNDALRTAWYPDQFALTPSVVSNAAFGQRFDTALTGQIYAQPLVANGTLFVATQDNWAYALDADTGAIRWSQNYGTPYKPSDIGCNDINPRVGITGTPVIDASTNIAYFVAKSYVSGSSGASQFKLYAVDLATGLTRPGWPVTIEGTSDNLPAKTFTPAKQLQRPGLLMIGDTIYVGFGALCDDWPSQGWVFGINTSGQYKARFTTHPSSDLASIWMAGGGLMSDGATRIFFTTGNDGALTGTTPVTTPPADLGEAAVRLVVQANGKLAASDFFEPSNASSLDALDSDLGSGAVTGLPSAYFGTATYPNLFVCGGKEGIIYLMNRDDLGGYRTGSGGTDRVLQKISIPAGIFTHSAVWPGDGGYIYTNGANDPLRVLKYGTSGSTPQLTLTAQTNESYGFASSTPVVTSNGTTTGTALVWMLSSAGALRAYDPVPISGTLPLRYSRTISAANKFTPVGIARNMVYVPTADGHIRGFSAPPIPIVVTRNGASIHLAWSSGIAPYTLRRSTSAKFTSPTTLLNQVSQASFDDPVATDGKTYFYLVN